MIRPDGKVQCAAGHWHFPALARLHVNCASVVHAEAAAVVHNESTSRHGKYADVDARRAYRRDWMARKRAELKKEA